jgi:hypothetical protein
MSFIVELKQIADDGLGRRRPHSSIGDDVTASYYQFRQLLAQTCCNSQEM